METAVPSSTHHISDAVRKAAFHDDSDAAGSISISSSSSTFGAGSSGTSSNSSSRTDISTANPRNLDMLEETSSLNNMLLPNENDHSLISPTQRSESDSTSIRGSDDADDNISRMANAARILLEGLGEDPNREGLVKTPMRMAKALLACTAGYSQDPKTIVSDALFTCDSEEMVIVRDIDCYSMCEHHMLPFFGKVHIGYLPQGKVIGLSKLARLTDCFAKRLQIQERLTQQIAQAVFECVNARGVAVVVEATHTCMTMRGVEKPGATTVSSSFFGAFKEDRGLRGEFMASIRKQ